jgi:hypothetical protein
MAMADDEVISAFLKLLPTRKVSLTITHNDHLCCYETVAESMGRKDWKAEGFLSPEDRQAAIDTNELWEIQWYPETPVGFCTARGSTLVMAIKAASQ